jgi:MFS family permease
VLPYDKPVRRLGAFAFLAAFCEALSFYAAALYAYQLTGTVIAVATVMTAVAIAEAAGAVLGGTVADRLDRRRAAGLGALAGGILLGGLAVGGDVVALIAIMVLATLAASPIRPVVGAALPNLVVDGDLAVANGYVQALRNAALTLAPVAAGLGVGVIGARGIFAVAAVSLLVAAVVLVAVRGDFSAAPQATDVAVSPSPLEGLAFLRRDRVLAIIVATGAFAWLTAAYCAIADLPLALDDLGASQVGYGVLVAAWGVGTTLGALGARAAITRLGTARALAVTMVCEGASLAVVSLAPTLALAGATFVVGGLFSGIAATADQLLIQQRVPDGARGRVRAASDAIMSASYAISLGAGGVVVEALGARGTYLVAGVGVALAGLAATVALGRSPAAVTR